MAAMALWAMAMAGCGGVGGAVLPPQALSAADPAPSWTGAGAAADAGAVAEEKPAEPDWYCGQTKYGVKACWERKDWCATYAEGECTPEDSAYCLTVSSTGKAVCMDSFASCRFIQGRFQQEKECVGPLSFRPPDVMAVPARAVVAPAPAPVPPQPAAQPPPSWFCAYSDDFGSSTCLTSKDECDARVARDQYDGWSKSQCRTQAKAACVGAISKLRGGVYWCYASFEHCKTFAVYLRKTSKDDYSAVGKCTASGPAGF